MYKLVCDICQKEKPDYYIKPPYSYYPSLSGSYCPFCHTNTYNRIVNENGIQVHYHSGILDYQDVKHYLNSEEYEEMKKKQGQVIERNHEIEKRDEKQIMDYVGNVKHIRFMKWWRSRFR